MNARTSLLVLDRDDELLNALGRAAPHLAGDLSACHQTAQAATQLADHKVKVLVAGPSMLTAAGIRFLQQMHEARPELITVLFQAKGGAELPVRDLVRVGASDLLKFPSAASTLRTALDRAVEMAGGLVTSPAVVDAAARGGVAYTITSPTGGCGKTFFATNLAYELCAHTGKRVAIIDLDLQFGEVTTSLRLRPQHTITDLLAGRDGSRDFLRAQLREYTVRHASGIEVLAAPNDPAEADLIASPDITEIVEVAKELYDYVIVDTPAALTEPVLAAFDLSERLLVLATLDLPSVKNLGVFLNTLERLKIPQDGVNLVLNKAESDVGLSTAEVQRLFRQPFEGILPYSKEASRSINTGRPVLESARGTDIGRALADTIRKVVPHEPALRGAPVSGAGGARRPGAFARLARRLVTAEVNS